jgi:hypothetical protein
LTECDAEDGCIVEDDAGECIDDLFTAVTDTTDTSARLRGASEADVALDEGTRSDYDVEGGSSGGKGLEGMGAAVPTTAGAEMA